jgi:hypothetical protein
LLPEFPSSTAADDFAASRSGPNVLTATAPTKRLRKAAPIAPSLRFEKKEASAAFRSVAGFVVAGEAGEGGDRDGSGLTGGIATRGIAAGTAFAG